MSVWRPLRKSFSSVHTLSNRCFGSIAHLQRDSTFGTLTSDHINHFKSVLDYQSNPNSLLSSENNDDLSSFNQDWLKKYKGNSSCVLRPKSTQELSNILKYCNEHSLAVCIQSGNTGLVGGSIPVFDEVVVSMSRMNNIISFDNITGILTCESGVILQECDEYLREKCEIAHLFPLDLGAKGSCQIGGNISTNAGGLRLVRFGSLHGNVLGLEVVLANGEVLNLLSNNRKDNTGYDLKQLFIGSEGTLGIVTKASILCPKLCSNTNLMFLSIKNGFENVLNVLKCARVELNEILSAVEFLDSESLRYPIEHLHGQYPFVLEDGKNIYDVYEDKHSFYMVIETMGSNNEHDSNKIEKFIENLFCKELINDGTFAESTDQMSKLWKLREGIGPGIGESGLACYKYDISLPLDKMYDIVDIMKNRFNEKGFKTSGKDKDVDIVGYGHLGDGNLHLNIMLNKFEDEYEEIIEPFIYEYCQSVDGSISAEHGIGSMKPQYLKYSKSQESINVMKGLKQLFDPKGILNPYKVLP